VDNFGREVECRLHLYAFLPLQEEDEEELDDSESEDMVFA
jgi:hypothetical protein